MNKLRKYPLSILVIAIICYLSLFRPPKTELDEIPNFDKLVHICMYGGLGLVIWFEYLKSHTSINNVRLIIGAVVCPILFSGLIELIQEYATTYRGGDWIDLLCNSIGTLLAAVFSYYVIKPSVMKRKITKD